MPLPDLRRNKVGNANRMVTEVMSIRLIVNELTPSREDDNAKNIGFEVVVVLFLTIFFLNLFLVKSCSNYSLLFDLVVIILIYGFVLSSLCISFFFFRASFSISFFASASFSEFIFAANATDSS